MRGRTGTGASRRGLVWSVAAVAAVVAAGTALWAVSRRHDEAGASAVARTYLEAARRGDGRAAATVVCPADLAGLRDPAGLFRAHPFPVDSYTITGQRHDGGAIYVQVTITTHPGGTPNTVHDSLRVVRDSGAFRICSAPREPGAPLPAS